MARYGYTHPSRTLRVRSKGWILRNVHGYLEYSEDEGMFWDRLTDDFISLALAGETDLLETIERFRSGSS